MKTKKPKYQLGTKYLITAKFEIDGSEVEEFLLKLKRAKVYWVEEKREQ